MAKPKSRIPLGDAHGGHFNNPFGALGGVKAAHPTASQTSQTSQTPPPQASAKHEAALMKTSAVSKGAATNPKPRKVDVRAERKGRGGKTVTLVRNLALDAEALHALAKQMRQALGCGASVEDDAIVLQGDQIERARDFLKARDAS